MLTSQFKICLICAEVKNDLFLASSIKVEQNEQKKCLLPFHDKRAKNGYSL